MRQFYIISLAVLAGISLFVSCSSAGSAEGLTAPADPADTRKPSPQLKPAGPAASGGLEKPLSGPLDAAPPVFLHPVDCEFSRDNDGVIRSPALKRSLEKKRRQNFSILKRYVRKRLMEEDGISPRILNALYLDGRIDAPGCESEEDRYQPGKQVHTCERDYAIRFGVGSRQFAWSCDRSSGWDETEKGAARQSILGIGEKLLPLIRETALYMENRIDTSELAYLRELTDEAVRLDGIMEGLAWRPVPGFEVEDAIRWMEKQIALFE